MNRYVIEALENGRWIEYATVGNNIFKARATLFRSEQCHPETRFRIADTLADKPALTLAWVNPVMCR